MKIPVKRRRRHPGRGSSDQAIVLALATGHTITSACEMGGVSQATMWRRLQRQDFKARIEEVQQEMLNQTVACMVGHLTDATKALIKIVNEGVTEGARVKAAVAIIEMVTKACGSRHAPKACADVPTTPADVVLILAARLRQVDDLPLTISEKVKLTTELGDTYLRAVEFANIVERVEALERLNAPIDVTPCGE